MSLIAAARTAADSRFAQQTVDMQTRLHVRLSAVLGPEYAEAAEYRVSDEGGQPFIMAVIEGLWFTEFGTTLHVFHPTMAADRAWSENGNAWRPVPNLAALGPLIERALKGAADPAQNLQHRWAQVLSPLPPREETPTPEEVTG